jgi:tRNA (guanine37-N1)-methyltransferase
MRIDILTVFPDMVEGYLGHSLLGRGRRDGHLDIRVHDLRSAASDPRRSVDDSPFGGGAGMVLAPGPIFAAVEAIDPPRPLILLSPAGPRLDQGTVRRLADLAQGPGGGFSLLCGRYEGVDQRVVEHLVDEELSIGDYVLAGGEAAALVVTEAVSRLVPGVMGNEASAEEESFTDGLLEYPQYTRPASFREWEVPAILLSGNHGAVERWRRAKALVLTLARRPDLIDARGGLRPEEVRLLEEMGISEEAQIREEVRMKAEHGYPEPSPGAPEEPFAP